MTDVAAANPAPRKRGPNTPEGKARSAQNALKHGLRSRQFGLLPEEDPAAWRRHVLELRAAYVPADPAERKLVDAIAVAMWLEIRADRIEAETLADIPPRAPGRSHGTDLQEPRHAAALGTALRYQSRASNAVRRALHAFLEHRKAKRDGLVLPLPDEALAGLLPDELPAEPANQNAPAEPVHENCTNEFPPEDDPGSTIGRSLAPAAVVEPVEAPVLPFHVEPDPEDEQKRQALLAALDDPGQRQRWANHPLWLLEHRAAVVDPDPAVYEEWFARQPKPDFPPMDLSEEDRAAIDHVTRHNPPWLRGAYLGYYRPPVPRELFEAEDAPAPEAEPAAPAPRADARAVLRARVERLLDRTVPREAEELDLAEAVCAVKWPKWPEYRGSVDLGLLRWVLRGFVIDSETLHWLGGKEIERLCRAAARQD